MKIVCSLGCFVIVYVLKQCKDKEIIMCKNIVNTRASNSPSSNKMKSYSICILKCISGYFESANFDHN